MSASVDRIAALLAKAERTDNEAEADAYLVKAQTLATLASVDLAVARARTARRENRHRPITRTTTIGERGRRANPHLVALYVVIAHANDARVDVASNSTYVIGYGMPEDLDAVEAIFTSLAVQMVQAGQSFVASRAWDGERYPAAIGGRRVTKTHTAQTARAGFYRAYVSRIGERLTQARAEAMERIHSRSARRMPRTEEPRNAEVVLRRKAAAVDAFHRQASSARGSWGGYRGGVIAAGAAARAGRDAASRARLGTGKGVAGPPTAISG